MNLKKEKIRGTSLGYSLFSLAQDVSSNQSELFDNKIERITNLNNRGIEIVICHEK